MGATIKTRGLIVNEAPMGEQDKRLVILCVDRGRISAIAKGAKKPGGKLASQAQLFYYCDFFLEQSRGFWMIREASVLEGFYELRQDIEALAWASWMSETAQTLAVEGEECNELLRFLIRGMKMVSEPELSPRMTATAFVLRALAMQGLEPEAEHCGRCGRDVQEGGILSLSGEGILCGECGRQSGGGVPVGAGGIYTLRHILRAPLESLYKFKASDEIQEALFEFTKSVLHNYVQKEMTSLEFLRNLLSSQG